MFQNLRQNNQIFVLHKESAPYLETGTVVSVTAPVPKFPMPGFPAQAGFAPPGAEMTVDLTVKINGQDVNFQKLPANAEIADFGAGNSIVVSASRDAMNAEVAALKQRSADIIGSVDFHKGVIDGCDKVLAALNPEFAEKREQQEEIASLKRQMGGLSEAVERIARMTEALVGKIDSGTSPSVSSNKSKKD